MVNLLKADFFRLFKSKSFYICALVSAGLFGLGILIIDWTYKAANVDIVSFPYENGLSYGITSFMEGTAHTITAIFVAIFATADFSHGTMKNVVSKGFSKVYIFLSKLIVLIVANYIIVFVTFIAGTICAWIVTGEFGSLSGDFGKYILGTTGIELYLYIALIALMLMVSMSIRNLGGAIAINVLGILSFESTLFALFEFMVDNKIKFSEFSLMYNTSFYRMMGASSSDYIRSLIVGAVFLVASVLLGIYIFKKSDVK